MCTVGLWRESLITLSVGIVWSAEPCARQVAKRKTLRGRYAQIATKITKTTNNEEGGVRRGLMFSNATYVQGTKGKVQTVGGAERARGKGSGTSRGIKVEGVSVGGI